MKFCTVSVGAALASPAYGKAIAGWFDKDRGAVMGLTSGIGSGLGSAETFCCGPLICCFPP